jgi:hypothetical protein
MPSRPEDTPDADNRTGGAQRPVRVAGRAMGYQRVSLTPAQVIDSGVFAKTSRDQRYGPILPGRNMPVPTWLCQGSPDRHRWQSGPRRDPQRRH